MSHVGYWQLIETAPRDGREILCCWAGRAGWATLVWKINRRISEAHRQEVFLDRSTSYFGDPNEMDDYDLAIAANQPTHWFDLPDVPAALPNIRP